MDDSGGLYNFFVEPNPKSTSLDVNPAADLGLFFSSPTTDIDDASLHHNFHSDPNIAPVQFPSLTPHQEANAQFESLLGPSPSAIDYHSVPVQPTEHLDHHSTLSSLREKPEPLDYPPSFCGSEDESLGSQAGSAQKTTSRIAGRKRQLETMRSVAQKNAPNVSLSDAELTKISHMHESEEQLAESKELYSTLVAFKKCFAKHGYRIKSLCLDAMPSSEGATVDPEERAFDFILDKKPLTSRPDSVKSEFSGSHDDAPGDFAANRLSVTMSATTSSGEGDSPLFENGERPRKRTRVSGKGENSSGPTGHRLSCAVCSRKMSDFGNLVRHFRHVHQELKPFMCPKCCGYYSSEGTLWHHISNVHTDARRTHQCDFCDASYDSSGAKTRHVNGTHRGQKTFCCGFRGCDRTFVYPAHLEKHAIMEHDGYKPFECPQCLKAFSSSNGLTRHEREVHRTEKAYTCPLCDTGITKRCHLKRHLQNVHHLKGKVVDEEMKKHPNPADLSAITNSRLSV